MKRIVVANWKTHPDHLKDARAAVLRLRREAETLKKTAAVICPPFVYLQVIGRLLAGWRGIYLGAQDVSHCLAGACTGEVDAAMLADIGVRFVIVGHSERRAAGESDALVSEKISRAVGAGLSAILCVGESVRDSRGDFLNFLAEELRRSLASLPRRAVGKVIVAYEPVWAIGKNEGNAIKPADLRETAIFIRKILADLYGQAAAMSLPILYGGSVTERNVAGFLSEGGVQGLLVGRASLDPKGFSETLRIADSLPLK